MAFIVVYDASVLYGNSLRDLLIRIAQTGLVQAKWTHRIIDEALTAVARILGISLPSRLRGLGSS